MAESYQTQPLTLAQKTFNHAFYRLKWKLFSPLSESIVLQDIFDGSYLETEPANASPFVTSNEQDGTPIFHPIADESITIQPVQEILVSFDTLGNYEATWTDLHIENDAEPLDDNDPEIDNQPCGCCGLKPYKAPPPRKIVPLDSERSFVTIRDYVVQLQEWAELHKEDVMLACSYGLPEFVQEARHFPFWVTNTLPESFYIDTEYDSGMTPQDHWQSRLFEIRNTMDVDEREGLLEQMSSINV